MNNTLSPMHLRVSDLDAGYGHVGVLRDVSVAVREGQIVVLVGSNGAGKSTLLKTISGLIKPSKGEISFNGEEIGGMPPERIVGKGLLCVAEGRRLFRTQTVGDNLELGLYGLGLTRAQEQERYANVFSLFPVLGDRLAVKAGILSGGQQQMLAIGQALMRNPTLLLLDEPSLGLAPVIIDQVFEVILKLRESKCSILLVEQVVERALAIADYGYVMRTGRVIGSGTPAELASADLIRRAYIGGAEEPQQESAAQT